ncbi:DUF2252 domain-containing protein [Lichenifustis flavocetrariae]|uniref:DUF2252 domain-containing protein n=1 Tax=Lichenifustis flavocetrariae TaxID=2949735 RepID=A0AA41YSP3_9HYPH|nr:DUF2252 domain-containing protein [Lichenifustis flavocetrariae]MCW6507866.1 DUF2252 domain-containing protein [Lichenifustis flavocetrariae]
MTTIPSSPSAATTREMRHDFGKGLRAAMPRERLAELPHTAGRDPLAVLAGTDRSRLPDLVPERYRRMSASPLSFFRGAAAVMAEDLRGAPGGGLAVQACGDCHIGNFGVGQSPEGQPLFEINDFDETLPDVDFTVDVKRLCASVALAVLEGAEPDMEEARHAAHSAAHAYRGRMSELALMSPLEVWNLRTDATDLVAHTDDPSLRKSVETFVAKGMEGPENSGNFQRLSADSKDKPPAQWRIADKPPNIFHWSEGDQGRETLRATEAFAGYLTTLPPERRRLVERYGLSDVAFKVVGVGSVGTFCALGLFTTPDGASLFLQIKEALPSVLTRVTGRDNFAGHQGERVVQGQRLMQSASDVFLGWTTEAATGRQFYVRHLKNKRLGEIAPLIQDHALGEYAKLCGATLARSHARSGDAAALAGYMGDSGVFDDALAEFAMSYAARTRADHAALLARHPELKSA